MSAEVRADMGGAAEDRNVARFGRWAETYDRSLLQRFVLGPVQEAVAARAAVVSPSPRSVLDVGCGTGQLLRRFARRFPGAALTGIDPSPEMVRAAAAAVPEGAPVTFVQGYAEHLPFEDAAFDLVATTMSFHHWADQPSALHEVRRVLAPEGAFLLADALATGWMRWFFSIGEAHDAFNTPARLTEMFREAGLTVERLDAVPGFGGTIRVVVGRAPAEGAAVSR
jgi:ubiquinone/menaquinone biosynthesis C-methylase UbiE